MPCISPASHWSHESVNQVFTGHGRTAALGLLTAVAIPGGTFRGNRWTSRTLGNQITQLCVLDITAQSSLRVMSSTHSCNSSGHTDNPREMFALLVARLDV